MGQRSSSGIFYCIDALQRRRRDRSILFWKSLPVSDLTTVLLEGEHPAGGASAALICDYCCRASDHAADKQRSSASKRQSVRRNGPELPLFQMSVALLYHLLVVHSLWYAPMFAWMLLVSGWARRAAFLWATLPLVAVCVIEKIAFNTSHVAGILGARFGGSSAGDDFIEGMASMHPLAHLTPGTF